LNNQSPLDLLVEEYLPEEKHKAIEEQVDSIVELPAVKTLAELRTPSYGKDRTELVKHRFLYRGAVCLLAGPTGIGKSSFLMQFAIYLSVGKTLFGIEPGEVYQRSGMRILVVQAENDEHDMAEMRDGVLAGCEDLDDDDRVRAQQNILICTIDDKSSGSFTSMLDDLITEHGPFDIVIVDPAFAYVGGDSNNQRDVSHFMRELINPLLHRHDVAMIMAHHTNKPARGKEKDDWKAGDYAYLGAGSAEWVNPARAALAIRSIGSDTVFELRAAKRGVRMRWKDNDGNSTTLRHIAHHGEPGVICWRDATPEEIEEVSSSGKSRRPRKCPLSEVVHAIKTHDQQNQAFLKAIVSRRLECSANSVQNAVLAGVAEGLIDDEKVGREKLYTLTDNGHSYAETHPSVHDWTNQRPESHDDGLVVISK